MTPDIFELEVKSAKGRTPSPSLHPSKPSFDDLQEALKHGLEATPMDHRTAKVRASAPRLVTLVNLFIIFSPRPLLVITIDASSLGIMIQVPQKISPA